MSNDPKQKDPRKNAPQDDPDGKRVKSILTVVVVALVFTVIINLVYTSISNAYLQEVTYSEFTSALEAGKIAQVQFKNQDRILFLTKEEAEAVLKEVDE